MRKLFLALLMLLTLPLQAQEYSSRYFHYDQYFDAPPPFQIRATTIDGADTNAMLLAGGGGGGTTRGAYVGIYGNEYSGVGELLLGSGNVAGSQISLVTGGIEHLSVPLSITAAATLAFGVAADSSPSFLVRSRKADAADDATLQFTAGGAWGTTRGAGIQMLGNDYGGAAAGAGLTYESGTGTLGSHVFSVAGTTRWTLPYSATATVSDLVFGTSVLASTVATVRGQRADGSDDGILCLTGGGACDNYNRGAYIKAQGNDVGGVGNGGYLALASGTADMQFLTSNAYRWTIDYNAYSWRFGTSATANVTAIIRSSRNDGSDDGTLSLAAGGAAGTTRGAGIIMLGDDVGGAGAGAGITYEAGTGTNGTHKFNTVGTNKWTIAIDGPIAAAGVAVASLPATCTAGAIWKATDSDDCNAGAGNGALCVCNAAGNDWALLVNY